MILIIIWMWSHGAHYFHIIHITRTHTHTQTYCNTSNAQLSFHLKRTVFTWKLFENNRNPLKSCFVCSTQESKRREKKIFAQFNVSFETLENMRARQKLSKIVSSRTIWSGEKVFHFGLSAVLFAIFRSHFDRMWYLGACAGVISFSTLSLSLPPYFLLLLYIPAKRCYCSAFKMRYINERSRKKTEEHEAFIINDGVKRLVGVQCKKSISNSKHMLYYGWKCLQ